jgi:regulator of replication initiation timing
VSNDATMPDQTAAAPRLPQLAAPTKGVKPSVQARTSSEPLSLRSSLPSLTADAPVAHDSTPASADDEAQRPSSRHSDRSDSSRSAAFASEPKLTQSLEERDRKIATLQKQIAQLRASLRARADEPKAAGGQAGAPQAAAGQGRLHQMLGEASVNLERTSEDLEIARADLERVRQELGESQRQLGAAREQRSSLLAELAALRVEARSGLVSESGETLYSLQRELDKARDENRRLRLAAADLQTRSERHELAEHRANTALASERAQLEHLRDELRKAAEKEAQGAARARAAADTAHAAQDEAATFLSLSKQEQAKAKRAQDAVAATAARLAAAEGQVRQLHAVLAQASADEQYRNHALAEQWRRMSSEVASTRLGHAALQQLRMLEAAEVADLRQRLHSIERAGATRDVHLAGLVHGTRSLQQGLDGSITLLAPASHAQSLAPASHAKSTPHLNLAKQPSYAQLEMHAPWQPAGGGAGPALSVAPSAAELRGPQSVDGTDATTQRAADELIATLSQQLHQLAPGAQRALADKDNAAYEAWPNSKHMLAQAPQIHAYDAWPNTKQTVKALGAPAGAQR